MNSIVEQIKNRLSITDVLSSYVTLIPAGSQFKAKCPFHNERTASFSISPDRGLYYCFGCGAKGDIFTFVEAFEGVDFNGALQMLADRAGIKITRDSFKHDSTTALYEVLEDAASIFEVQLASNSLAKAYLAERGVTEETIKKFRIGYAPDSWDTLARRYSGIKQAVAEQAGLLKPGDHGLYDRFRARIMFPIGDSSGRIVGFSGRMFPDVEGGAKYLNSPETPLFQKSKLLFGFDKAKFDIKRRGFAILVEGQFDLILSHQFGFTNTVATSGTALGEESLDGASSLQTLARLTNNLMLAYDGDEAGKKAMDRAAQVALRLGMNPKVAALPAGSDPADFLRTEGSAAWKEQLRTSEHVVVFQAKDLLAKQLSPHQFAAGLRERVFPYLALIPFAIERVQQLELVASAAGLPSAALQEDFSHFLASRPKDHTASTALHTEPSKKKQQFDTPALFLGILSWQTGLAEPSIDSALYRDRAEAISFEENRYTLPELTDDTLHAARMYAAAFYSSLTKESLETLLDDQLQHMTVSFLHGLRTQFTVELHAAERAGDESRVTTLLSILHQLSVRLQGLKAP
ncbi:MAG TPA: DNA primase [Candidatus Paceibacterota bacterium]|nr:DNA primase [Candidatus Paceibacterota bacterium]